MNIGCQIYLFHSEWLFEYNENKGGYLQITKVQFYYRKTPKISPGAYIFQRPVLRGLFLERLIFGRAYARTEICVSKSIKVAQ